VSVFQNYNYDFSIEFYSKENISKVELEIGRGKTMYVVAKNKAFKKANHLKEQQKKSLLACKNGLYYFEKCFQAVNPITSDKRN